MQRGRWGWPVSADHAMTTPAAARVLTCAHGTGGNFSSLTVLNQRGNALRRGCGRDRVESATAVGSRTWSPRTGIQPITTRWISSPARSSASARASTSSRALCHLPRRPTVLSCACPASRTMRQASHWRCSGTPRSTPESLTARTGRPSPAADSTSQACSRPGAALLRWRPNQSLRRRRGRRQLDPSRRGEERRRVRWPTVLLSSATDGGLPLVLARFVRGLSTHQGSGCVRRLRTAATAAKCHRAPVDSHRVADQLPTGPSMSRRRAPHAASPLPRG